VSALTTFVNSWPERTPVQHKEAGTAGTIGRCPSFDPIARDHAGRATTGHLLLDGTTGVVWVAWADRPGCWMNPRWLIKASKEAR
jgi:hypothetical protein